VNEALNVKDTESEEFKVWIFWDSYQWEKSCESFRKHTNSNRSCLPTSNNNVKESTTTGL
jgi:hypothetical protein